MKRFIQCRYLVRFFLAGFLLFASGSIVSFYAQPWSVQGSDIEGEEASDQMGSALAINGDGSLIVTSSPNHDGPFLADVGKGQVRVFAFDGIQWNQVGGSIYGNSNQDHLGTSVSISENGNFMAIGSAFVDGISGMDTDAGQVRYYQSVAGFWVPIATLYGTAAGDRFSQSVSLSADGHSLAVGADGHDAGGTDAGQTTIYTLSGMNLTQQGNAINGAAAGDLSGHAVSLSDNGMVVAIGSHAAENSSSEEVGHVRVFAWNGSSWVQRGNALEGDDVHDNFGISLSLNADGSTLAAGSSTHGNGSTDYGLVRTFQWSGTAWSQRGSDITGGTGEHAGASVELDSDGNTMIVGAIGNGSTAGRMRLYEWVSSDWVQQGADLLGKSGFDGFGHAAGISGDGAIFGGGSDLGRGYVRVYGPCENMGIDTVEACDIYTWIDGLTYTASNNTATWTLTNAAGCDSVVTLNLTILESNTGTDEISACVSHTWIDGVTYTESNNTATWTLTNAEGCDSVVTLDLTIAQPNTGIDVVEACDSFTWIDGVTYTDDNNAATWTLTNAAGCDSVVTLNLTILESSSGVDVITACDSYTWIDGVTYTESNNTATHTLTNAVGCDSVVTLNLTILESSTGVEVVEACDSYTWIDGVSYTESNNTATWTLTNEAGCDSVVTLNLTILESNAGTDVIQSCVPYTWIDGVTYAEDNNTATWTLTNAAGCDSVVTLNLSIVDAYATTDVIHACESYTWIDGITYTESNHTATVTLTSTVGCDSVVTLDLTI